MLKWEVLPTSHDRIETKSDNNTYIENTTTYRAKILGGWLVKIREGFNTELMACVFVSDPQHKWDGSSPP